MSSMDEYGPNWHIFILFECEKTFESAIFHPGLLGNLKHNFLAHMSTKCSRQAVVMSMSAVGHSSSVV